MATDNAIRSFTLDVGELGWTGQDLQRPESGVAEPDGTLWVSDGRGGVMRIDPDGGQALLAGWGGEPNGLAIDPDGNLVTANIALGRVQRMTRDGQASTVLEEVDGQRTTSANFVFYDRSGRLWLTCLTREDPWWPAVADARPDGFIVLVDERGPRIVADGIYATNEARLDAEERYLYVAETMKARILRFEVRADGSLGEREVFGPDGLGRGGFVDGFSFDAEGNLWVTTVVRNGLGVLTRDGDWHVVVEDPMRTRSPPSSTGWRQARRCRTICWPAPARGCSSRPVCASPARTCARRMWARWPCRGCQPSALPSRVCRCATGPEPSERSPAGPPPRPASPAPARGRADHLPEPPGRAWPHCNSSST
jgi:gluconolactonase